MAPTWPSLPANPQIVCRAGGLCPPPPRRPADSSTARSRHGARSAPDFSRRGWALSVLDRGFQIKSGYIAPQLLEPVEAAGVRREDVQDDVEVVGQDPGRLARPFHGRRDHAIIL